MTWAEGRRLTIWATQAPQSITVIFDLCIALDFQKKNE